MFLVRETVRVGDDYTGGQLANGERRRERGAHAKKWEAARRKRNYSCNHENARKRRCVCVQVR